MKLCQLNQNTKQMWCRVVIHSPLMLDYSTFKFHSNFQRGSKTMLNVPFNAKVANCFNDLFACDYRRAVCDNNFRPPLYCPPTAANRTIWISINYQRRKQTWTNYDRIFSFICGFYLYLIWIVLSITKGAYLEQCIFINRKARAYDRDSQRHSWQDLCAPIWTSI